MSLMAEAGEREEVLEAVLRPQKAERTVTPAEVEARGGLSAQEVAEVIQAAGFPEPPPDEPALTPDEAEVFVELGRLREVWPFELTRQSARVYGRLLSRIARTSVQLFRLYAQPRIEAVGGTEADQLTRLGETFERLGALPDPLLTGIHKRWFEYELAQSRSEDSDDGTVEIALLFCDLKDFTAYANAEGDAAAVEAITEFARTVDTERGEGGDIVKALGDGHMLSYADTTDAVAAGSRIIAAMGADDDLPGVHASVHRGTAVAREGDYFGGAVNLAARLLNAAGRDELVATTPVVESTGNSFDWEPLGERRVRGVSDPVEVYRLRS